jgi:pSer/pThr/pTyr-binding forkhead associated (FHA) protein
MQTQLPGGLFESLPVFRITGEGWKHPAVALDRPVCVIGRQERANLPLQEAHVSKLHAFVVRDQGRVYLRDLASTNGVQLNGAPVEEVGLSDEDVLRIGTFTLRCASGFSGHVDDPRREELPAMQNGAASSAAAAEFRWDDEQFTFPPGRHTVLIGRRPQCDLRLDHPSVAPVHAILFEIEGERFVQDLATPSGTTLNGRRVHRAPLNDGDELRVGTLTLRYVLAQEREAPEAALEGEMVDSIFGANAANEDDIVEAEDDSGSGIASTVMRDDEEPIRKPSPRKR